MNDQIKMVYRIGLYIPIKCELFTTCESYKWFGVFASRQILGGMADWVKVALLSPCDIRDVGVVDDILNKMWKEEK